MVLSRSIITRAKYVELLFLDRAGSRFHTFHCTRQGHVESASATSIDPKPRSKKSKKKLQDLPSSFTLPDGTPAKPLGDWRAGNLIKDSSSSCATPVIDSTDNGQFASSCASTSSSLEGAATQPVKPRRTRKKASQTGVTIETESPAKRGRPKKSALCDDDELSIKPRTILAQGIQENLLKFPHCLLLTRVGQFYESYFEQAEEIAHLLNIKLTSRKWGGSRVAMCGFPLIHLDKHLKVLVQQHKRFVAMCEEFPRKEEFGFKDFERRVTRIITPGTLIDEPFLNAYENNFLLAISAPSPQEQAKKDTAIGLAWIDVSTGEFYSKCATLDNVQDQLVRINPREVVLPRAFQDVKEHTLLNALAEEGCLLSFVESASVDSATSENVQGPTVNVPTTHHQLSLTTSEQGAVDLLTSYLNANLLESMPPLMEPIQDNAGRMQIDAHTIKALEIREASYEGGTRGSLFSVIKRTVTSGGTRLLSRWLCSPSTSLPEITARQSLVEFFMQRPHLAADLAQLLSEIDDTSRLTQKFLIGRGDPSDLMAVSRTIRTWSKISAIFTTEKCWEAKERPDYNPQEWASLDALISRMHALTELSNIIDSALGNESEEERDIDQTLDADSESEDEPNQLQNWKLSGNRWFIKPAYSKTLRLLHERFQELLTQKDDMEHNLQSQYNAPSLTLRASPAQGLHVHLSRKRDQGKLNGDANFVSTYESGSTKCFFYKDWSHLGNQITDIIDNLTQAEKDAFDSLQNMIAEYAFSLRRNTEIIDELDVGLSFAKVADELKFVKPTITTNNVYDIVNGRHPSVEIGLLTSGRVFTPNSVCLHPEASVHIITGPNMAGKSTFLRQTALISILAQIGSFVPAEAATIGIVDKLFSRIGAKDDLFKDRSTFMVEMLETADILKRATDKSLVIMDEVGRGTTVNDGLAIAFATVHHLTTVNQCRTLFATHFHELANLLGHTAEETGTGAYQNIRFYCTDVDETDDGYFAYSYRMRPGINWDSHGLKVAQLAGLPGAVIEVASDTLRWLK
ncbi:hypothetical protein P691DRAFT_691026, partial [Macrolepiota fuliginosa MF-IS2]